MTSRFHFAVAMFILLAGLVCLLFNSSPALSSYAESGEDPFPSILMQSLDDEDKQEQASALFHLAGGKKMLDSDTPDKFGDDELEHKNQDALKILSQFFHGSHKKAEEKGPKIKKSVPSSSRGRVKSQESSSGSKSSANAASEGNPENKELERMKARSEADVSMESPNEELQGLIAGWSGAGWWQPCAEVCRPKAGTKHTKANFKIFTDCEQKCRETKTEKLKEVMKHIRGSVGAEGEGQKAMAPHTIQKLSKFLLKWAQANGLPASVAADANTNLADNEQAGESISGMLIAGWSGAGWWKPCGLVCRPDPGTPHTKANFDKFMACENSCRKSKAEYLHGFLTPKAAVKALAKAKHHVHSKAADAGQAHKSKSEESSDAVSSDAHTATARHRHHAAATHAHAAAPTPTASPTPAAAQSPAAAPTPVTAPAAAPTPAKAKAHLSKQQKLIQWAEAHGLPKKLADNPADKLKVCLQTLPVCLTKHKRFVTGSGVSAGEGHYRADEGRPGCGADKAADGPRHSQGDGCGAHRRPRSRRQVLALLLAGPAQAWCRVWESTRTACSTALDSEPCRPCGWLGGPSWPLLHSIGRVARSTVISANLWPSGLPFDIYI